MKIIESDDVDLKIISEVAETQSPTSEITIKDTKIKLIINGAYLEACIKYDERYLVFTTDDCPFEESLNIYLLSETSEIIDSATVFWPYATGSFKLLSVTEPDLIQFSFFADKKWQVKIFKSKKFHIPYISEPCGVWRKFKIWRYFAISKLS